MSAAAFAARYIERFHMALVPLDGKRPLGKAWNADENLIRSEQAARDYWTAHPHRNIGACLEPSGLVSIDADYPDGAHQVLAAEGIDLDALIVTTPTILGRAPRLEFRAPDVPLSRKSVVWPARQTGEKPVTVLEFRAGRVQDVLPPSIHPDLRRPYQWLTPPRDGFPPLPGALLALWLDFEAFKHRARNLCPWAPPEPEPKRRATRAPYTGSSVIAAFNAAHDSIAILESHGYARAGKRRWRSPDGHGMAGVVLLPDGKIFCHHSSDALGDEKPHDAFDLYVRLEHHGDVRAATRTAARLLGMVRA
ncbi:MAG TPA: bifunctional DNA primase/polymerase [Steroidobacteraceae bacterium]|jgi:putative DNA primase/helicase|nr:bifunctional DNA primase/polymerase [Steroidobacteraceae bacterium]